MIEAIIISLAVILVGFAGLFNSEMDDIRLNPSKAWFLNDWWLGIGKYKPNNRSWFTKYVGSMFADGWHFCKSLMILCFCNSTSILYCYYKSLDWYWWVIIPIILMIIFSVAFEQFYNKPIWKDI